MENGKSTKWWQKVLIVFIAMIIFVLNVSLLLFVLSAALVIGGFWLFRVQFRLDEHYEVENINGKNSLDKESAYYFYQSAKTIYGYSLTDNEEAVILEEEQNIWDFCSYGDWIFYTLMADPESEAGQEIWEYNWVSGEKSLLLADAECTYITAYNDYLIYDNFSIDYICAIGGDMGEESRELLSLFDEEDSSGEEQFMVFQGMLVGRQYDSDSGTYGITCVRGETGERILKDVYTPRVLINGSLYSFSITQGMDSLNELIKPSQAFVDYFAEATVTAEDGKIIGLTSALYNHLGDQSSVAFDILFEIDPETGQVRILYCQKYNMPRIIGYRDGMVYLMENYKLYREPIEGSERVELFQLPEEDTMHFQWQGNYLIVRDIKKKIIGAYLVEDETLKTGMTDFDDEAIHFSVLDGETLTINKERLQDDIRYEED